MSDTRVFKSGNSQAVRIPAEFRIDVDVVEITRHGDSLILKPKRAGDLSVFDPHRGLYTGDFDRDVAHER